MNRAHMFDALDKLPDALKAEPEGFYTRFAVTFSSEEATEHGDLPDDLADGRRCFREGLLGEVRRKAKVFAQGRRADRPGTGRIPGGVHEMEQMLNDQEEVE